MSRNKYQPPSKLAARVYKADDGKRGTRQKRNKRPFLSTTLSCIDGLNVPEDDLRATFKRLGLKRSKRLKPPLNISDTEAKAYYLMLLGHFQRLDAAMKLYSTAKQNGDCIEFASVIMNRGYGKTSFLGKPYLAHRLAYEIFNGTIEGPEMQVCHKCDNRACINPSHLFLGTNQENHADMMAKGRYFHKVPKSEYCAIAELSKTLSTKEIAERYGVGCGTIWKVLKRCEKK